MQDNYKDESPLTTEIRRILSKLKSAHKERPFKIIMITSSILGEGKSTISHSLAIASAKYSQARTVLIDLDLRRPRIHELFEAQQELGAADILAKGASVKSCLKKTSVGNLYFMTSGRSNISSSELLSGQRLKDMFSELKFYFDVVIVDSPPVVPVSDPLILSSEIDGAIFVVKAGKTQTPVIKRGIQLLRDAKIDILGVVLNNMQHALPYYYDYGFYEYEYSSWKQDNHI